MPIPRFWREIKQRYKGIGSRCKNCGVIYFPPRKICPECRRESFQNMEEYELEGKGEVVTFTEIHEPHPEFEMLTPYIMAIVEMEEGVRLTGHLVNVEMGDVEPGMKVEATMRKLGEESSKGLIYYGYKFWPLESKKNDD
ncbi:MAG: Zn-ribbon domain-containing OB-fold protein [Candidatus Aenigmatarchaeota archaeon]